MDEAQIRRVVGRYSDMILRIGYSYLLQMCDAEDICQQVFEKYISEDRVFESDEHEKAWLIRVTVNQCKNHLKQAYFRRTVPMEEAAELAAAQETEPELLDVIARLPYSYRVSIYLYYYEGYSAGEIGAFLGKNENTIAAYLSRGRKKLRDWLTEEDTMIKRGEGA